MLFKTDKNDVFFADFRKLQVFSTSLNVLTFPPNNVFALSLLPTIFLVMCKPEDFLVFPLKILRFA